MIAYLGYLLTFGMHDYTILPRALIAVATMPVLPLITLPGFGPRYGGMTVALTFRLHVRAAVRW